LAKSAAARSHSSRVRTIQCAKPNCSREDEDLLGLTLTEAKFVHPDLIFSRELRAQSISEQDVTDVTEMRPLNCTSITSVTCMSHPLRYTLTREAVSGADDSHGGHQFSTDGISTCLCAQPEYPC
jgi:hypothetical protein